MKCIKNKINKVAILGAGVMGSSISAHIANVGVPVLLLDFPGLAKKALEKAKKSRPPDFYLNEFSSKIETGDYNDLKRVRECDLIIEAILERMEEKKSLLKKLDKVRRSGSIVSTNTCGLSVNEMADGLSRDMQGHFMGTHFFNPARYSKLLEIIPAKETRNEVVDLVRDFAENVLGKRVLVCKDAPGFVANRVGIFYFLQAMKTMLEDGYSIQEVDIITGRIIGHQKSAIFRGADISGLDTLADLVGQLHERLKDDDERDVFKVPEILKKLVDSGALGAKTNRGFYVRTSDGEIIQLDYKTGKYKPKEKLLFPSISKAKDKDTAAEKIKIMFGSNDRASKFLRKTFFPTFLYCAKRLNEFTVLDIDNAIEWGYNWGHGIFGKWDIVGVKPTVEKMKREGLKIPDNIKEFLRKGNRTFYKNKNGVDYYYDFNTGSYQEIKRDKKIIMLKSLKDQKKIIMSNSSAALIDLGKGVACLEFNTKMNIVDFLLIRTVKEMLERVEKGYGGVVIANQGSIFSSGGDLRILLDLCMRKKWKIFKGYARALQEMNMRLRYSSIPVLAAPFYSTLGAGCEMCLYSDRILASAETYMGLVESRIGFAPNGGGCKEMLWRGMENIPPGEDEMSVLRKIFATIFMSKISSSAEDARRLGFLSPQDRIIINRDYLIYYAREAAIGLSESGYKQPEKKNILVTGRPGMAVIKAYVDDLKERGGMTEHDEVIALKLGYILTGGNIPGRQYVSEQYLLDLEIEVFMSLIGMRKTQDRVKYMLEKGRPLRN